MSQGTKNLLEGIVFQTKDVPTLYCNHASPSISFNDLRIYFAEVAPKELAAVQSTTAKRAEPTVTPRICVVVSPEFAKALAQSILTAVDKYENLFGPLRPSPTQEQMDEKLPG
ncbi:MAG TPA: DUF3467 domain-containing protein [Candidatus Acidoferrum sp.]|nr:DUF3467 domain-containing protein [Candidatus Acidoferrum sp.]